MTYMHTRFSLYGFLLPVLPASENLWSAYGEVFFLRPNPKAITCSIGEWLEWV